MRPNSTSGRHWDGSPRPRQPRRSLQVAAHSPSRLLRAGQSGRCRSCGNRIDWYQRTDHRPIALHPAEVATADVPEACRCTSAAALPTPMTTAAAGAASRTPPSAPGPPHTPAPPIPASHRCAASSPCALAA